ncbi:MAG: type II secretion system protein GspG [Acidobacteriota bacterium]|nr:type II secretion system protein GspG [Acidobacteriota bacterium]
MISISRVNNRNMVICFRLVVVCLLVSTASVARADLSNSQARNLIRRAAGFDLTGGSVRVKTISPTSPTTAEVAAEVRTVFKFEKDKQGNWRVAEVRTGQDRWEQIDLLANALGPQLPTNDCATPDPPFRGSLAVDPSTKRARCLLGKLLGIEVPSDALRIQQIAPFVLPMASQPSAVVVAWVKVEAQLANDNGRWRVVAMRTGQHNWVQLEPLIAVVNAGKQKRAEADLQLIAKALERFRADRGFYIVSDDQAVVINHLNPNFLAQVIRVDPWHQPYKYQGQRDHFTLRSTGPDAKDGTADDVVIAGPSR